MYSDAGGLCKPPGQPPLPERKALPGGRSGVKDMRA